MKTLTDLIGQSGVNVLDHLARDLEIPVLASAQAQGDLIVLPLDDPRLGIEARLRRPRWVRVPPSGIEVLRGINPHLLVADAGAARWTTGVEDETGLALGVLDAKAPAYLLHPEHGGSGLAPGRYLLRRQRELGVALPTRPGEDRRTLRAKIRLVVD